jgi:hypothetical protein
LATQIRTRLVPIGDPVSSLSGGGRVPPLSLDALYFGRSVRQHVREFAAVFSFLALVIVAVRAWDGKPLFGCLVISMASVGLYALGRTRPALLVPFWRGWMWIGEMLHLVLTPLILFLMWWVLVVPIGTLLRLCRIKVLDLRFRVPVDSYWVDRKPEKNEFRLLERQF